MFVQVIEGHTSDPEGLSQQGERWEAEVGPSAIGHIGVTAGVTADGRAIAFAQFESEEQARQNEALPQQQQWAEVMMKRYDSPPTFTESSEVDTLLGGPSTAAGFVQVMKVKGVDRAQARRMDDLFEKIAPEVRPDLLGSLRVWTGPDTYVEANYFTSEAEARAGEANDIPTEAQELMAEFGAAMSGAEYFDLQHLHIT